MTTASSETTAIGSANESVIDRRPAWIDRLDRIVRPVLINLAAHQLRRAMPVRAPGLATVMHLEAIGRTLVGIAPWLEIATALPGREGALATELATAARQGLINMADPASPDHMRFDAGAQNLVDAAFLCLAFLRAPTALWQPLPEMTKQALLAAIVTTRQCKPADCNWLLFSAMVEAWLHSIGAPWQVEPVDHALTRHEDWYKGDGTYGDGPTYHADYYNSYVIQPMLLTVIEALHAEEPRWAAMHDAVQARAVRFADIQERSIASDGSFPPIGRSIAYRSGAFHHLSLMALRRQLPKTVTPAQVRCALAAVHARTLDAPGTFDAAGWLNIGLAGHQPSLAERYISTGSLYLCTLSFLPLGLPPEDPFWADPPANWTQRKIWSGEDLPADHAM